MAKRSTRLTDGKTDEYFCMKGLFGSCQLLTSCPKLISNGRATDNNHTDHRRRLDHLTGIDEGCRKNGSKLDLAGVHGSATSVGSSLIQEDRHKRENIANKGQQHTKMDCEFVDCLLKTHKRVRKKGQIDLRLSSPHLSSTASLPHHSPSTSADMSLNKVSLAPLLRAVPDHHQLDKDLLSECLERRVLQGSCDQADQINMRRFQISAKALADQMFIESLICKQWKNSESNSFPDALQVLNLSQDLFMDLFPDANSLLLRHRKTTRHSQTEKETFKPALDAEPKLLECKNLDSSGSRKPGSVLAATNCKMNKHQCSCSPKTSVVAQPLNETAILKPAIKYTKQSESMICHCSPVLSHRMVSRAISDAQRKSFSLRGMTKRLKRTFGGTRKGPSQFTREETEGMPWKKQEVDSNRALDVGRVTDTVRKKLDFSGCSHSKKQEFDVNLEAKRHLSARLKNLKEAETVDSDRSFRTLRRILASPEHELWSLSPGRENRHCSCSALMRFSPYNTSAGVAECSSQILNGTKKCCLNPSGLNAEVTWYDDYRTYDGATKTSLSQSTDGEAQEPHVSGTENTKFDGDDGETSPRPVLRIAEVSKKINTIDITRAMEITDTINSHENDSLSENEMFTSTVDDLPSTPSSVCQLDAADCNKFQEHQSPVSVLEPLFVEDANSPQSTALQTAQQLMQQLHLDFEESSLKSIRHDVSINTSSCMEELQEYVQSVLQASCLDWDLLSETSCVSEELLHASLFDAVVFLPGNCHFDPKLLFDLTNEALLSISRSHFCFPPRPGSIKLKIMRTPLPELVLDKIMTKAELHFFPWTEKRTLEDKVSKDITNSGSWLDVRLDTEQLVADISEDFLKECIEDMILESLA